MPDRPWKAAERRAADLIGGKRYPANLGAKVDIESSWACGQVKEVATLSLAALTTLAVEAAVQGHEVGKSGFVFVRHHQGRGRHAQPMLVVCTEEVFAELHQNAIEEELA